MNGFAEQFLHFGGPQRTVRLIQHSLEIAKLMLQAKLKDAGRRIEFRPETIPAPTPGGRLPHQFLDDFRLPSRDDLVVDGRSADENPVPKVAPADPSAGLIALDHGA